MQKLETAYAFWTDLNQSQNGYNDAHCWAFTPASFELLVTDLAFLGLARLKVVEVAGPNGCEFYTHLRPLAEDEPIPDRASFYENRALIMQRSIKEQGEIGNFVTQ